MYYVWTVTWRVVVHDGVEMVYLAVWARLQ
jgi:hypothetical protein